MADSPKLAYALFILLAVLPHGESRGILADSSFHAAVEFQKEVVDKINGDPSIGWTAGFNGRFHKAPVKVGSSLGAYLNRPANALPRLEKKNLVNSMDLPTYFDAREKWPNCPSLSEIRDQGHCGSCWAFGAVEAFSDRICIHNKEADSDVSANDLVACCTECGDGCNGGWPYKAWKYFAETGVVTKKCQPYFDQQGCKHPGCEPLFPTPSCTHKCVINEAESSDEKAYTLYNSSKHFAESYYSVGPKMEEIMLELYENGPLEVSFVVYEDFTYYKNGVYRHVFGDVVGGHAVKLIGWGTTPEGVDYWIIANSWNRSWGEDGYFRIVRGVNDCEIEADVVGGIPAKKSGLGNTIKMKSSHSISTAVA